MQQNEADPAPDPARSCRVAHGAVDAAERVAIDIRHVRVIAASRPAGRSDSVACRSRRRRTSLRWTIHDLATARPGIRVSELASLLALPASVARRLAERAVRNEGVTIELDQE